MQSWTFEKAKRVRVEAVNGPLAVRGHDENAVVVQDGGTPECSANEAGEVSVKVEGPANLLLPRSAALVIARVTGPLTLENLDGDVAIGSVLGPTHVKSVNGAVECRDALYGPASFSETGQVSIERCLGKLAVSGSTGVEAGEVAGALSVRNCTGVVKADKVLGSVDLANVAGGVEIGLVAGNLRLTGRVAGSGAWTAEALANVLLVLDDESSAKIRLVSSREDVSVEGFELQGEDRRDGLVVGTLGDGEASLDVRARGRISLQSEMSSQRGAFGFSFSAGDFAAGIDEVLEGVEAGLRGLGEEIAGSLRFDQEIESLGERLRDRIQRDVERFVRRHERRAKRAGRSQAESASSAEISGAEARESQAQASRRDDQDALRMVLRMVAEGKINPEEGERLLRAMGAGAG